MQFMRKVIACIICLLLLCGICLTYATNIDTHSEGDEWVTNEFIEETNEPQAPNPESSTPPAAGGAAEDGVQGETGGEEEAGTGGEEEAGTGGEEEAGTSSEEGAEEGGEEGTGEGGEEGTETDGEEGAEEGGEEGTEEGGEEGTEIGGEEEAEAGGENEPGGEMEIETEPGNLITDVVIPLQCLCCTNCPLCFTEEGLPAVEICACYDESGLYLGCGCECVVFSMDASLEALNEEAQLLTNDGCEEGCSCRLMMAMALEATMEHTDGGAIVFTFSQLRKAIEVDGYTLVYLGYGTEDLNGETKNDGRITFDSSGGIKVTRNITIVGTDPRNGKRVTLQDYSSSLATDTIYALSSGLTIRIQDATIIGNNFFGIIHGLSGMATSAEFSNVSYSGRQITCLYGSGTRASFSGCNIRIQDMGGNSGQEVAEAGEIRLYGSNTITRNAGYSGVTWSVFWLNASPYKLTVDGSTTIETNNYLIHDSTNSTQMAVNGVLNVKTTGENGCMTFGTYSLQSCSVGGALNISHEGGGHHSLRVNKLNVAGTLTIDKPGNSNACVFLELGGSATFSSPQLVRLKNASGPLMRASLTTAPISISTQVLNSWTSGKKNVWNHNDVSTFDVNFSVNTSGAVSGLSTNLLNGVGAAHQAVALNASSLTFATGPQVTFGKHMVTIDELIAGRKEVVGTASGGEQTVEEYGYVEGSITNLIQSAVADGNYRATMNQPIQKRSLVYVKSRTSDLEAHVYGFPQLGFYLYEVPDTMDFGTVAITAQPRFVYRVDPNWKISVMDYRDSGELWKLYASTTPMQTSGGIPLDGEMMFVSGGGVVPLEGADVRVAEQTFADFDTITDIMWAQNEGICLYLRSLAGDPEHSYGSTISWTLTLGP